MERTWKIAGVNFDHQHMGDLLKMVSEHPRAELVGICHPSKEKMQGVIDVLRVEQSRQFLDYRECLERTRPDVVILCPATAQHGEWTHRVASYGVHILMEKPFAASLAEADGMIRDMAGTGKQLAINWPLRWYPSHITAKRLVDEGLIGELVEVHYYDGNRGPLRHVAGKEVVPEEIAASQKSKSWFYKKAEGGGSLLDYLGYGTTLGTWFLGGRIPREVTSIADQPADLEVDEHSVTVARYDFGLSKFETRWGTFSDPWAHQPQPRCGFVLVGREGTISSYDYEQRVHVQTKDHPEGLWIPVDTPAAPQRNPVEYFLHCLDTDTPVDGPLSPRIARIGQQIVDAAVASAAQKRTVPLPL